MIKKNIKKFTAKFLILILFFIFKLLRVLRFNLINKNLDIIFSNLIIFILKKFITNSEINFKEIIKEDIYPLQ